MQILQGMQTLGFFDESLATMQRKFILYHENILGCQRNNPRGNVLPSLRSGGLFYPRCARVKQLPPFSSIGKNNFPPLVFLRLPKFFHNTRTSIPLCFVGLPPTTTSAAAAQLFQNIRQKGTTLVNLGL